MSGRRVLQVNGRRVHRRKHAPRGAALMPATMSLVERPAPATRSSCFLHGDYDGDDCPKCRDTGAIEKAEAKRERKRVRRSGGAT